MGWSNLILERATRYFDKKKKKRKNRLARFVESPQVQRTLSALRVIEWRIVKKKKLVQCESLSMRNRVKIKKEDDEEEAQRNIQISSMVILLITMNEIREGDANMRRHLYY